MEKPWDLDKQFTELRKAVYESIITDSDLKRLLVAINKSGYVFWAQSLLKYASEKDYPGSLIASVVRDYNKARVEKKAGRVYKLKYQWLIDMAKEMKRVFIKWEANSNEILAADRLLRENVEKVIESQNNWEKVEYPKIMENKKTKYAHSYLQFLKGVQIAVGTEDGKYWKRADTDFDRQFIDKEEYDYIHEMGIHKYTT